jgi:hypothetical protein
MLRYQLLAMSPALLRSFTGLDKAEFDSLYSNVESRHSKFERERLSRGDRERAIGAGRPFALSLRDRLLMLLVYYRLYVSTTLIEFLFEIDQTNACRNIRILEPLVRQCVPLPEKVTRGRRGRARPRRSRSTSPDSRRSSMLRSRRFQDQGGRRRESVTIPGRRKGTPSRHS